MSVSPKHPSPDAHSPQLVQSSPDRSKQAPALQVRLLEHVAHVAPPMPQYVSFVASTQVFPEQHPPAQFVALHAVPPEHFPAEQVCPPLQARQAFAPEPQAPTVVPARHWPSALQQPLQLAAEQPPHNGADASYG